MWIIVDLMAAHRGGARLDGLWKTLHIHGSGVNMLVRFGDEHRPPAAPAAFVALHHPQPDLRPVVGAPRQAEDVAPLQPAERFRQFAQPASAGSPASDRQPRQHVGRQGLPAARFMGDQGLTYQRSMMMRRIGAYDVSTVCCNCLVHLSLVPSVNGPPAKQAVLDTLSGNCWPLKPRRPIMCLLVHSQQEPHVAPHVDAVMYDTGWKPEQQYVAKPASMTLQARSRPRTCHLMVVVSVRSCRTGKQCRAETVAGWFMMNHQRARSDNILPRATQTRLVTVAGSRAVCLAG